jgi:DNA repair protein RadC
MPTVNDLPEGERPRSRIQHCGPGALSNVELLAILLGTPYQLTDAQRLLDSFEGLPGIAVATLHELTDHDGIGPASACRIKAALELGRRLFLSAPADRPQVRSPADAANLLMAEMGLLDQEELRVILLDTRNRVIAIPTVYRGSLNTAMVRVGEVFKHAIRENAAAILVAHNHPSKDPSPSPEDVQVTRLMVEAGTLSGCEVLDHIIVCQQRFVSLKERGLGFK